jgi:hypothetical protein
VAVEADSFHTGVPTRSSPGRRAVPTWLDLRRAGPTARQIEFATPVN